MNIGQTLNYEKEFEKKTGKVFSGYYRLHFPKLVWYTVNICKNKEEAEDIANKAFMRGLERIEQFDPRYEFSTWIYTMARKMALQYLKDNSKISRLEGKTEDVNTPKLIDTLADDDGRADMDRDIKSRMKHAVMMKHIDNLDTKYKAVISLREVQNMQYKDISDTLNINLSTVKSQIRQGRLILQRAVQEEFDYIDENF